MSYITTTEVETYAGLGTGTIDASLVTSAEAFFDSIIGYNLAKVARTEVQEVTEVYSRQMDMELGRTFYLETPIDSTQTIEINNTALASGEFYAVQNRLVLKTAVQVPTFPPIFTIEYTGGYNPIPSDVKSACILITLSLNSKKNANGISSFRQDLLSVNYSQESLENVLGDPTNASIVRTIVNKYRKPFIAG